MSGHRPTSSNVTQPDPSHANQPLNASSSSCRISFPRLLTKDNTHGMTDMIAENYPQFHSQDQSMFLAIEYPGFVMDIDKAIGNLKGEENVKKAVLPVPESSEKSSTLLKLFYRPLDATSHPLQGEIHSDFLHKPQPPSAPTAANRGQTHAPAGEHAFDFLIKVKRSRRKAVVPEDDGSSASHASTAAAQISCEYLGQIASNVAFQGLSDFQLITRAARDIDVDVPQLWPESVREKPSGASGQTQSLQSFLPEKFQPNRAGEITIAPPLFSRYDYPRDYNFANHDNSNMAARAAEKGVGAMLSGGKGGGTGDAMEIDEGGEEKDTTDGKARSAATKPPSSAAPAKQRKPKRPREQSPSPKLGAAIPAGRPLASILAPVGDEEMAEEGAESEDESDAEGDDSQEGASASDTAGGGTTRKVGSRRARRFFITWDDKASGRAPPAIPTGPEPGSNCATEDFQSRPAIQYLKKLFSQRAIWSIDALVLQLESDHALHPDSTPVLSRQELLHHLIGVAFRFSGGPWRNLWIRFGYDPRDARLADEARMFQVIDYRLNRKLFDLAYGQTTSSTTITSAASGPGGAAASNVAPSAASTILPSHQTPSSALTAAQIDISFTRLPTRLHTSYQIIDLDAPLKTIISLAPIAPYTKEFGWISSPDLQRVRTALNMRVTAWCTERGVPSSDIASLLEPEKKRTRKTLGRQFANERIKAKTMQTVRKPRAPRKKDPNAPPPKPRVKKQKLTDATVAPPAATANLSLAAVTAAASVATAAMAMQHSSSNLSVSIQQMSGVTGPAVHEREEEDEEEDEEENEE